MPCLKNNIFFILLISQFAFSPNIKSAEENKKRSFKEKISHHMVSVLCSACITAGIEKNLHDDYLKNASPCVKLAVLASTGLILFAGGYISIYDYGIWGYGGMKNNKNSRKG